MASITLTTLNARYIHASLGLRYLFANMGELQSDTRLIEFTLDQRPDDIVEQLVATLEPAPAEITTETPPIIVGFGVYIWNVEPTTEVIQLLKLVRPDCIVVVGGPEVSFEMQTQTICALADHVVTGQADHSFAELCQELRSGISPPKQVSSLPITLDQLASPYPFYTDTDLAQRVIYVEASRGCPFKCEFCLSSLDKTATPFDLEAFLGEMQKLIDRGARQFKFVDRTFNLKAETGKRILEFFLAQMNKPQIDGELFLHFELIPDRLPAALQELLPEFPPGTLQFEIGIQSFTPDVQQRISRKQDHTKTTANLRWLVEHTHAHVHADLIFGLPGETLASFGRGFDELYSLGPQEIQVGLLKRLRGTPITRHTEPFDMRYMPTPPYRIMATRDADFSTIQRMVRFARYWDLIGNSGRFPNTLPVLLGNKPFLRFLTFSDWIYATYAQTHKISLQRLFKLLHEGAPTLTGTNQNLLSEALTEDYAHNALKGRPAWLTANSTANSQLSSRKGNRRQQRHLPDEAGLH